MQPARIHLVRTASALLCPVLVVAWLTGEARSEDHEVASASSILEAAETVSDLNDAYVSLLGESSLQSPDTGLALQAAWEEVKQSMPRAPASPVRSRRVGMNKLHRVALARFIGFVEGRLRVQVPGWWEEHLCIAKGNVEERTGLLLLYIPDTGRGNYASKFASSDEEEFDLYVRGDVTSVEVVGKEIVVHLEGFPLRLARPLSHPFYVSTTECGPSNCLVLVHSEMPTGELCSVDLKGGQVLWKQKLWCDYAPFVRGGAGFFHWSEAIKKHNTVFVFGLCNDVVYIEGFEYVTGDPVFRFSTTYGWSKALAAGVPISKIGGKGRRATTRLRKDAPGGAGEEADQ